MSLKFYNNPLSQPSRSVHNFLLENNISHESIFLDLATQQNKSEIYLKINPHGSVPAIVDGDFLLTESAAIMIHLAISRKLPDHWYPSDPQIKASVNQYLHWHHQNVRKAGATIVYKYLMKDEEKFNQAIKDLAECSKAVEQRLSKNINGYIAKTTGPSIADLLAFHEYVSQVEFGFLDLSQYPHIQKWYLRLRQRESCKKCIELALDLFNKITGMTIISPVEKQDLSANGLFSSDSQLSTVNKTWGNEATEREIEITKKSLEEKKHRVNVVSSESEALKLIKKIIPSGASVYNAGSTTLQEIGLTDYLKEETPYKNLKNLALSEKDFQKQKDLYRQGMFAEYFISSITAVSQEGEFAVCDLTGTRVGGFQTAKNVIIVIGSNKIVRSSEDIWKRTKEYCLPLESARVRQVFKFPASSINNMLLVKGGNPMAPPGRFHFIIVKKGIDQETSL